MVKELKFVLLVSKDLPNQLKMKVRVDKNKCLGCGMCISLCPAVFELKNGKSQVKSKADLEKYKDCIKEAAENCPVAAITIEISKK
jgi:ferredoxin